ncbi:MAG: mRNA surveillance protein Pelota [Candidatus Hecatellales archaeon B24]|nr:MAG: mRNA surveillance protein Pelota [Candidatus Hecatellales archaeon B24]
MKILSLDLKHGFARLLVETPDDLWHLYNVISPGDVVYARTSRELKSRGEAARPGQSRRVSMTLGVKVKNVEFGGRGLRILGVVVEAPERYEGILGSHHTLNIPLNSVLRLVKEEWPGYQVERLRRASEAEGKPVVIVALDDEEACVALVGGFKVDVKLELRVRLPGKREPEKRGEALKKYFSELLHALQEVLREVKAPVAVVGPGFVKEEFLRYAAGRLKGVSLQAFTVSSGGLSGVREAVRSGILLKFARESRLLEEAKLVEEFLAELSSDRELATYGLEAVEKAAQYGAVERLLVVDRLLREAEIEERRKIEEVIRLVENKGGKVTILAGEHEGGEKIMGLGGIAAILRFKTDYYAWG